MITYMADNRRIKIEIDKKDLELKANEEKVHKFTVQLNTVRTNKEYSLLTNEIKSVRADDDVIEDVLLNLFNQNDTVQKEIIDIENKLKQKRGEVDNLTNNANNEIAQIKTQIDNILEQRHQNITQIDSETLGRYERISRSKPDNIALACVIRAHDNLHEYRCGCCQMDIPPQQVVELMRNRSDKEMICCKSCMRILFFDEPDVQKT